MKGKTFWCSGCPDNPRSPGYVAFIAKMPDEVWNIGTLGLLGGLFGEGVSAIPRLFRPATDDRGLPKL